MSIRPSLTCRTIAALALMSVAMPALAGNFSWTDRTPMLAGRANHGGGVINNIIYIAGGGTIWSFSSHNTGMSYDPNTDTWSSIASMTEVRSSPASAVAEVEVSPGVFERRLFMIGGMDAGSWPFLEVKRSIEVYDPLTDRWSSFPQSFSTFYTAGMRAATVDNLIWVIGGHEDQTTDLTDAVWVIDPVLGTINPHPQPLPVRMAEGAIATVGRKIYYLGGWEATYQSASPKNHILDVDTGLWTLGAAMPRWVGNASAVTVGTTIYLIGGWDGGLGTFADVLAYNTVTDTWTDETPLDCTTAGRWGTTAHIAQLGTNDHIFVTGGHVSQISGEQSCVEMTALVGCTPPPIPDNIANRLYAVRVGANPSLDWTSYPGAALASHYHVHRTESKELLPGPVLLEPTTLTAIDNAPGAIEFYDVRAAVDCGHLETQN